MISMQMQACIATKLQLYNYKGISWPYAHMHASLSRGASGPFAALQVKHFLFYNLDFFCITMCETYR